MENEKKTNTAQSLTLNPNTTTGFRKFISRRSIIILSVVTMVLLAVFVIIYSKVNERKNYANEIYKNSMEGNYPKAISTAKKALKKYPNSSGILAQTINVYALQGNQTGQELKMFTEAQPYVDQALKEARDNVDVLIAIGYLNETAGKYEEALGYYNKAIQIDPSYAVAYFHKGHALAFLSRNQESNAAYDKAYELNPDDPLIQVNKGNSLQNQKKYKEALELFLKAAENGNSNWSNRAEAYTAASIVETKLGDKESALELSKKAVEFDPNYSYGLGTYGMNLGVSGKINEGFGLIEKSIEVNPRVSRNYMFKGIFYRSMGEYQNAIDAQLEGINRVEGDNTLVGKLAKDKMRSGMEMELAQTYSKAGNTQKSIEFIQKAVRDDPIAVENTKPYVINYNYFENLRNSPVFTAIFGTL